MHQDAAFLADILTRRRYRKLKKIELPENYWNLPQYKRDYQVQIMLAVKLLPIYDFNIISSVLSENPWIYSLALKKLHELLEIKKEELNVEVKIIQDDSSTISFRKK